VITKSSLFRIQYSGNYPTIDEIDNTKSLLDKSASTIYLCERFFNIRNRLFLMERLPLLARNHLSIYISKTLIDNEKKTLIFNCRGQLIVYDLCTR